MAMDQAEAVFFDSKCPHCQHALAFPEGDAGAVQDCPWCGAIVVVPLDHAPLAEKLPLPIASRRLQLRPLTAADAPQLAACLGDAEAFPYWDCPVMAWEDFEQAIAGPWSNRLSQDAGSLGLAIVLADQVIGLAWFSYRDPLRKQGVFSLVIVPAFQGCGYGAEVTRALLGFGFNGLHLHRLAVTCDSRHAAARRMLEQAGMRREGEFRQDELRRGVWTDTVPYAMLSDEFDRPPHRAEPAASEPAG